MKRTSKKYFVNALFAVMGQNTASSSALGKNMKGNILTVIKTVKKTVYEKCLSALSH
jgi:hypothetical protein